MKDLRRVSGLALISMAIILHSCKKEEVPALITASVTNITGTTATGGGTITDEGSGMIVEKGICWNTGKTPTVEDDRSIVVGSAEIFTGDMSGLDPATTYFVRAYATNESGTGYGEAVSFTTLGQTASSLTQPASDITPTSATLNGVVIANYLSTTVTFEYGTSTNYGQSATAGQSPVTGNSLTGVNAEVTGLTEGTVYHFRLKTVNSLGTTYGNDLTFSTPGQAPSAVTTAACCLSSGGGRLNGTVNANWVSTVVTFEYGLTEAYGMTVTATQSPVTGNILTNVSAGIYGLNPGTNYHFRVKAVNSLGTTYGEDKTFTTLIVDRDGNVYQQIIIGTQVWMSSNLKTTRYNDGTLIPNITDPADWSGLSTDGYCWYNNDAVTYKNSYGALYNWYSVNTGKLCPDGWHVPTDSEWTTLTDYLGGESNAGGKLKETGTWHWLSPNLGATNETGFTALPGSFRDQDGSFSDNFGRNGYWWSTSESGVNNAWSRYLHYNLGSVGRGDDIKKDGFSVRCIKN